MSGHILLRLERYQRALSVYGVYKSDRSLSSIEHLFTLYKVSHLIKVIRSRASKVFNIR